MQDMPSVPALVQAFHPGHVRNLHEDVTSEAVSDPCVITSSYQRLLLPLSAVILTWPGTSETTNSALFGPASYLVQRLELICCADVLTCAQHSCIKYRSL
jgi:hypothetical protein